MSRRWLPVAVIAAGVAGVVIAVRLFGIVAGG